jgi:hypothetical protein
VRRNQYLAVIFESRDQATRRVGGAIRAADWRALSDIALRCGTDQPHLASVPVMEQVTSSYIDYLYFEGVNARKSQLAWPLRAQWTSMAYFS